MQEESKLVKYPRTMHLPWSPGLQNDDRVIEDLSVLESCDDVVVTEKMDGENTTLYCDTAHARSLTSGPHPSRAKVKELWQSLRWDIPPGMRICGENMYAKHSIYYDSLRSYFLVFNIWLGDVCLSWEDTILWCGLLGLDTVPVLYRGKWNESVWSDPYHAERWIRQGRDDHDGGSEREGFVVRLAEEIRLDDFGRSVAKYVRKGHVQTDEHWMSQEITPNKLSANVDKDIY